MLSNAAVACAACLPETPSTRKRHPLVHCLSTSSFLSRRGFPPSPPTQAREVMLERAGDRNRRAWDLARSVRYVAGIRAFGTPRQRAQEICARPD